MELDKNIIPNYTCLMKKKNLIISAALILITAGIVIWCIFASEEKINKRIVCCSSEGKKITVTFDCVKHRRFFSQTYYYKGSIDIDGVKYISMFDVFPRDVRRGKTDEDMFLNEEYSDTFDRFSHQAMLVLYSEDAVWISVLEKGDGGQSGDESTSFFGPAENKEEAVKIWDIISSSEAE